MEPHLLLERLIYLDRDFIAGAYEALQGHAPMTQITKSEGMNAGAKIPIFSANLSATETRTFSISTFGMAIGLLQELERYPQHVLPPLGATAPSRIGWIEGEFSVFKVVVSSNAKFHDQLESSGSHIASSCDREQASETYFGIRNLRGLKLALVTSPDYFSSGVASLTGQYETILEHVSIPVRALVRVYGAKSSFDEWMGVPLFIYEHASDG